MPKDWKFKLFEISHLSEPNNPPNETKQADPKEVAFYQEAVGAWFQTNLEHDKTKVTLASGAIGLLITLFCFCGKEYASWTTFLCMFVSILFFLATIIISEVIFQKNATLIENIINGKETPSIGRFDKFSWITFILGIVFALIFICNVAGHVLPPFCT
jgi:small-conductance mechanosensitive channel